MWFWFAIIALLCWSGSDLFSKIGCQHEDDKLSHLKMVMAVGLVMGIHAAYEIFFNHVEFNGQVLLTYLPVSVHTHSHQFVSCHLLRVSGSDLGRPALMGKSVFGRLSVLL